MANRILNVLKAKANLAGAAASLGYQRNFSPTPAPINAEAPYTALYSWVIQWDSKTLGHGASVTASRDALNVIGQALADAYQKQIRMVIHDGPTEVGRGVDFSPKQRGYAGY